MASFENGASAARWPSTGSAARWTRRPTGAGHVFPCWRPTVATRGVAALAERPRPDVTSAPTLALPFGSAVERARSSWIAACYRATAQTTYLDSHAVRASGARGCEGTLR